MRQILPISCALALAVTALPALAQDEALGQAEYQAACAVCHGNSGMGDGPIVQFMSVEVPDLTVLAQDNGGVFPFMRALMVVDGRDAARGHGSTEMPIWGNRFSAEAEDMVGSDTAELVTRGRLLSLVLYLESIQQ